MNENFQNENENHDNEPILDKSEHTEENSVVVSDSELNPDNLELAEQPSENLDNESELELSDVKDLVEELPAVEQDEVLAEELVAVQQDESPNVEFLPEVSSKEEISIEDTKSRTESISEEIRSAETKLSDLQHKQEELNQQLESIDQEIEDYLGVLEDLNQWMDERKRSYAWKLMEALRLKENLLKADENKLREFSKTPIQLDDSFAPKTRRWVLKSILSNWLISLIAIVGVLLIRRNKDEILASFSGEPSSGFFGFLKNLAKAFVQNLDLPTYLSIIILVSTLLFAGTLFSYSRKVSRHSREIDLEAHKAREMSKSVIEVKQSRERLDSLHPQVPQLLEVLSMALHQPYKIDNRYYDFKGMTPDTSEIPESLEFAAPTEDSIDRVFETLVLKTLNEIQQVGWRKELLELTLQGVGESVGIGVGTSALRDIEADQRRIGKRHLLLNLTEETKDRPLLKIGDELITKFAEVVQEKVLPFSQPEVKSLRPDPLEALDLSDTLGMSTDSQVSQWEVKLTEAAGISSPWSTINFSNEGQSHGKHLEPIESIFIASKQTASQVANQISTFAEVDPGTRPFEVSIRADLSAWCKPGDLAIFEGLEHSDSIAEARISSDKIQAETDNEVIY